MDLHPLFHQGADVTNVVLVAVEESVEGLRFHKLHHLGFVLLLAKLAPHASDLGFSQRATSWVMFDARDI